jgi:hypothetical protein
MHFNSTADVHVRKAADTFLLAYNMTIATNMFTAKIAAGGKKKQTGCKKD